MPDTTLTRADVEALRDYLVTSRRPVGAMLAYCATLLRTDLGAASVTVIGEAVLTCVAMERLRWAMELQTAVGPPRSGKSWPLRDDIIIDVLNAQPISVTEFEPGASDRIRPTVHEPDGLPSPAHLEVVHPGRSRAGAPEPAEALRRRIVTLLAMDTLTAWQLKTAMQVPYQDVLRALLTLEGRGVARRIVDAGHPDLWALVAPGN